MKTKIEPITYLLLLAVLSGAFFSNCAKVVSPTGGPRDTIPPVPIRFAPPNYSVNFDSKEIEIEFNEFVELKDIKKQFISSPPFEEDPIITGKGKHIEVEIEDILKDSTTYTLNFGNSIVDFHEGNPIKNFRYVFSTGDELDSLELTGKVLDAFTMEPQENILVMLYSENRDSVPLEQLPEYVGRTDEKGEYYIGNIRLDSFKLFALNDKNSNYIYDMPEEKIAFQDSLLHFVKEPIEIHDTIFEDTLIGPEEERPITDSIIRIKNGEVISDTLMLGDEDSLLIDTVIYNRYVGYTAQQRNFKLFNEENRRQYLKTNLRKDKRKLAFVFNRPVIDSIRMSLIDSMEHPGDLYIREKNGSPDTVAFWLKDSSLYNREKLTYEVSYQRRDSLNQLYWQVDTVDFRYKFTEQEEKPRLDTIPLTVNLSEGKRVDLNQEISIQSKYPLKSFDTTRICLWESEDTLFREQELSIEKVENNLYSLKGKTEWKPGTKYRFIILPQSVYTVYEFYHDTLQMNFSTREEDYYGTLALTLNFQEDSGPFIIQLLKETGEIVREKWLKQIPGNPVGFHYIHPGKYKFRLIFDENGNKEWDTGDYLEHRQPEKIRYYPENIEVRANWEMDLEWKQNNQKESKP